MNSQGKGIWGRGEKEGRRLAFEHGLSTLVSKGTPILHFSCTAVLTHSGHLGSQVSAPNPGQLLNWVMVTNGNRKNSLQSRRAYFISVSPQLYRVNTTRQEGKLRLREAERLPESAYVISPVASRQTRKVKPQSHNLDAKRGLTLNYYFLSSTALVSDGRIRRNSPRFSQPSVTVGSCAWLSNKPV